MQTNETFLMDVDTILFRGGNREINWSQFRQDIGRFANHFSNLGPDTVILYIQNDFYLFCVCFFALLYAHKSVALPGLLTIQNASDFSDLTNVIVTDLSDDFPEFTTVRPDAPDCNLHWDFGDISNENVYFFTSGSTGKPKRIKKTMAMLLAEVEYHVRTHAKQISESPVVVASIAPHHMYGVLWRVLFPMIAKLSVDIDMIFTPEELIEKQSVYDKIMFITTPSFLDGITRYGAQYDFPANCIGIFTSGSLLDIKTATSAYNLFGVSPFEVFGSTETGGVAYRQQKNTADWTIFDDVHIAIVDGRIEVNSPYSFQNPYLMSDAVDMIDVRHFRLLGRADRIVKIAEERISLPDMEKWLGDNKYIARAYCAAMHKGNRDIIGCMMELTDVGAAKIIAMGRRAFIDEIKKYLSGFVPTVALPRCIRIVNQIPTNPQGKFVKNEILAALDSSVVEPIVQNVVKTDAKLCADLTFLGDSAYFVGHFPKFPILPGVIQMHFVFLFIKRFFNCSAPAFDVVKLKYTSLILPDVTTNLELERLSNNEFVFCYAQHGKACSAGKIVITGGDHV